MAVAVNKDDCRHEHERVDARFEKGEIRMEAHESLLHQHNETLAVMQKLADRQANVFWQLLSPILSIIGGIVTGVALSYMLTT
jgi:hypothetical protein